MAREEEPRQVRRINPRPQIPAQSELQADTQRAIASAHIRALGPSLQAKITKALVNQGIGRTTAIKLARAITEQVRTKASEESDKLSGAVKRHVNRPGTQPTKKQQDQLARLEAAVEKLRTQDEAAHQAQLTKIQEEEDAEKRKILDAFGLGRKRE